MRRPLGLPASALAAGRVAWPESERQRSVGFGISKVKTKIATGELRSIRDGKYRRILPEWVEDYIREQVERQEAA
ncbi:hypothetical protein [Micromonospora sp. CNB394]|uniref:hypothetical protein n=1 Tax=Micromonospora sp. CNB394 TaxID=1169151 RepID=UPI0003817B4C|nr:hypothetical protein [Micromonospora sp. CNB394]